MVKNLVNAVDIEVTEKYGINKVDVDKSKSVIAVGDETCDKGVMGRDSNLWVNDGKEVKCAGKIVVYDVIWCDEPL